MGLMAAQPQQQVNQGNRQKSAGKVMAGLDGDLSYTPSPPPWVIRTENEGFTTLRSSIQVSHTLLASDRCSRLAVSFVDGGLDHQMFVGYGDIALLHCMLLFNAYPIHPPPCAIHRQIEIQKLAPFFLKTIESVDNVSSGYIQLQKCASRKHRTNIRRIAKKWLNVNG